MAHKSSTCLSNVTGWRSTLPGGSKCRRFRRDAGVRAAPGSVGAAAAPVRSCLPRGLLDVTEGACVSGGGSQARLVVRRAASRCASRALLLQELVPESRTVVDQQHDLHRVVPRCWPRPQRARLTRGSGLRRLSRHRHEETQKTPSIASVAGTAPRPRRAQERRRRPTMVLHHGCPADGRQRPQTAAPAVFVGNTALTSISENSCGRIVSWSLSGGIALVWAAGPPASGGRAGTAGGWPDREVRSGCYARCQRCACGPVPAG